MYDAVVDADNNLPGRKSIEALLHIRWRNEKKRSSQGNGSDQDETTPRGADEFIIGVKNQFGDRMKFRVRKTTTILRVGKVYCAQKGLGSGIRLVFSWRGQDLDEDSTLETLQLTHECIEHLDVVEHKPDETNHTPSADKSNNSAKWVSLIVRAVNNEESKCKVKRNATLGKLFDAYAGKDGLVYRTILDCV
jgi:hypothetical protein